MSLPDPAQIQAQVAQAQATAENLPAEAQAKWAAATSDQAAARAKSNGIAAATGLLQNGYDPGSAADNQALIASVAGGLAFIPVSGPFLAGALLLLDAAAAGIADVLESIGLIPKPGCVTKGSPPTAAQVLDAMKAKGAQMRPGSFASLALPAIAYNVSEQFYCRPAYPTTWVLQAMVNLWNQNTPGVAWNTIWDIPLSDVFYPMGSSTPFGAGPTAPNNFARNPNLTYLFQNADPLPVSTPSNLEAIMGIVSTGSQTMQISVGPWLDWNAILASQVKPMSTGTKVAIGVGATAAVAAGSMAAYGLATGRGAGYLFGRAATGTKGLLHTAGLAAEEATRRVGRRGGHSKIQSLLFPRSQFTESSARAWAKREGLRSTGKVDITKNYIRLRQLDPKTHPTVGTIRLGDSGVKATIAR